MIYFKCASVLNFSIAPETKESSLLITNIFIGVFVLLALVFVFIWLLFPFILTNTYGFLVMIFLFLFFFLGFIVLFIFNIVATNDSEISEQLYELISGIGFNNSNKNVYAKSNYQKLKEKINIIKPNLSPYEDELQTIKEKKELVESKINNYKEEDIYLNILVKKGNLQNPVELTNIGHIITNNPWSSFNNQTKFISSFDPLISLLDSFYNNTPIEGIVLPKDIMGNQNYNYSQIKTLWNQDFFCYRFDNLTTRLALFCPFLSQNNYFEICEIKKNQEINILNFSNPQSPLYGFSASKNIDYTVNNNYNLKVFVKNPPGISSRSFFCSYKSHEDNIFLYWDEENHNLTFMLIGQNKNNLKIEIINITQILNNYEINGFNNNMVVDPFLNSYTCLIFSLDNNIINNFEQSVITSNKLNILNDNFDSNDYIGCLQMNDLFVENNIVQYKNHFFEAVFHGRNFIIKAKHVHETSTETVIIDFNDSMENILNFDFVEESNS